MSCCKSNHGYSMPIPTPYMPQPYVGGFNQCGPYHGGYDRGGCGFGGSWIIIIIVLLLCCGGSGFGGGRGCDDGFDDGCGFGSWWIIIIILLLCCGGSGFGF